MSIQLHRHGSLQEIRLARPPVNALTPELLTALRVAVQAAPAEGARGIILTGGDKVFSGGMDVPHLMGLDRDELRAGWSTLFSAARAIARSPVPVVAAIGGHSPAGGCVLALCCDYRIMARGPFRIGLNEVQVGLVAPDAIQYLMRRVVGTYRAERLLVSGALVEAEHAQAIGLVDELTDAEHVTARAVHWLEELLKLPAASMQATRTIARADLVAALDGFDDHLLDGFLDDWYSAGTQAALQALVARLKK
ncbi:enoyl-CoA hydratase/isomerase family protein [Arenimonas sp. MALMAid1274]|uniref:enoyl-CoA hydratase/isomerase family protein n=1 Tax=Arenimonas sp. MALMAid1274 TaxID=3411630 RepID=UPI003BA15218